VSAKFSSFYTRGKLKNKKKLSGVFFYSSSSSAYRAGDRSQPDPSLHPGYGALHPLLHRGGVRLLPKAGGHRAADRGRRADGGGRRGHGPHGTRKGSVQFTCWCSLHSLSDAKVGQGGHSGEGGGLPVEGSGVRNPRSTPLSVCVCLSLTPTCY